MAVLGNLSRWLRGFVILADLGRWSRISQQMAKDLSAFLADGPGFVMTKNLSIKTQTDINPNKI